MRLEHRQLAFPHHGKNVVPIVLGYRTADRDRSFLLVDLEERRFRFSFLHRLSEILYELLPAIETRLLCDEVFGVGQREIERPLCRGIPCGQPLTHSLRLAIPDVRSA